MRLTYIHIQNFKSIRDMEIRDIDRALILVGKNNTGKTSVLDAVCAALGCYEVQEQDFNEQGQAVRIAVRLELSGEDLELFHRLGRVSKYRRRDAWLKSFCERLPSFEAAPEQGSREEAPEQGSREAAPEQGGRAGEKRRHSGAKRRRPRRFCQAGSFSIPSESLPEEGPDTRTAAGRTIPIFP